MQDEEPGPENFEEEEYYRPSPPGWMSWVTDPVLLVALSLVFAVDQITKAIVRSNLLMGQSIPFDGPVRITHTFNTGSAFGLFPDQTLFLIFASFFGIGVLLVIYGTQAFQSLPLRISLGIQLGGAVGNLFDRIRTGQVTDFIDIGPWPIFNVADSCIVVGLAIISYAFLFPASRSTALPGVNAYGVMPALPCPICDSDMGVVPRGRRCFGCGVYERVDGEGTGP